MKNTCPKCGLCQLEQCADADRDVAYCPECGEVFEDYVVREESNERLSPD